MKSKEWNMENEFLEQTWVHIPQIPLGSRKHPEQNPLIAMPMAFPLWFIRMMHPFTGESGSLDDKACWTLLPPCHASLLASCLISPPQLSVCISLGFAGLPLSWSGKVGIGYFHSHSDDILCYSWCLLTSPCCHHRQGASWIWTCQGPQDTMPENLPEASGRIQCPGTGLGVESNFLSKAVACLVKGY